MNQPAEVLNVEEIIAKFNAARSKSITALLTNYVEFASEEGEAEEKAQAKKASVLNEIRFLAKEGVPPDKAEFYHKVDTLDASADKTFFLALAHQYGLGVEKDLAKARSLYETIIGEHLGAQANYAVMLEHAQGGPQDLKKARSLFKAAAEKGDALAMKHYAYMLWSGKAGPQDAKEARSLFQTAADKGYLLAVADLATMMRCGRGGRKDEAAARMRYRAAAEAGSVDDMSAYAYCLFQGIGGSKNEAAARELFKQATAAGLIRAKCNYAFMLHLGIGGAKELPQAKELYLQVIKAEFEAADSELYLCAAASLVNLLSEWQEASLEDLVSVLSLLKGYAPDNSADAGKLTQQADKLRTKIIYELEKTICNGNIAAVKSCLLENFASQDDLMHLLQHAVKHSQNDIAIYILMHCEKIKPEMVKLIQQQKDLLSKAIATLIDENKTDKAFLGRILNFFYRIGILENANVPVEVNMQAAFSPPLSVMSRWMRKSQNENPLAEAAKKVESYLSALQAQKPAAVRKLDEAPKASEPSTFVLEDDTWLEQKWGRKHNSAGSYATISAILPIPSTDHYAEIIADPDTKPHSSKQGSVNRVVTAFYIPITTAPPVMPAPAAVNNSFSPASNGSA